MLFKALIHEDEVPIVFQTGRPIPFSIINDGAFNKTWQPWRDRYFAFRQDSTLVYRKRKDSPIIKLLDLKNTKISKMALEASPNPLLLNDIGITVTCHYKGLETTFRCILDEWELHSFFEAVNTYVINPTLPSIESEAVLLDKHKKDQKNKKNKKKIADDEAAATYEHQSYMRQSLTRAMDKYEHKTKYERILYHRGSMQFLPIFFDNDLIHGSWWFVFGSFLTIVFSSIILANSYYPNSIIGLSTGNSNSDNNSNSSSNNGGDGELNSRLYQAVWICMIISGVFFFLGSLSFVRAMFVTPPMKPLFSTWYHLSSDELLGSWCFLLGCLPFIPYCMVYFITQQTFLYFVLLLVSFIVSIGAFVFVLSCYPGYKARRNYILPVAQFCCLQCCFSTKTLRKHLYNDWLAGTWIMFWGTFIACIGCIVLTVQGVKQHNSLKVFMYATGLIQMFCFLLGAAYFVAGSYPPAALALDECVGSGSGGVSRSVDNTCTDNARSSKNDVTISASDVSDIEANSTANNSNSTSNNNNSGNNCSNYTLDTFNNNKNNNTKVVSKAHTNMDSDSDDDDQSDGDEILIKSGMLSSSSSSSSSSNKNSNSNNASIQPTSSKLLSIANNSSNNNNNNIKINDKVKYNDVLSSSPIKDQQHIVVLRRDSEDSHNSNGSGSFSVDVVLNPLNTISNNNTTTNNNNNTDGINSKSGTNNTYTTNSFTNTTSHTLISGRSDDAVDEDEEEKQ